MSDSEPLIVHLTPREHVRTRTGMYLGSTDARALHQLIYEVVGAAIKQDATSIMVTLHKNDAVTVKTDGSWLSVRKVRNLEESVLEIVMSYMAGRALRYSAVSQFARVDLMVVNALSARMDVEARQEGYLWWKSYAEGLPTSELVQVRPLNEEETVGYTFTFTPDFTIFEHHPFDYRALVSKLRELAYLLSDIAITLCDERDDAGVRALKFHYPEGLQAYMQYLNRDSLVLDEVIHVKTDMNIRQSNGNDLPLSLEFAVQYTNSNAAFELSFANGAETSEGGTHAKALREGVFRFISGYALHRGYHLEHKEDVFAGFTGVISIQYPALSYAGATTSEVVNPDFKNNIFGAVYDSFEVFAKEKPEQLQRIIEHLLKQKHNRNMRRFGEFSPLQD